MVDSATSSEHPNRQTAPADKPSKALAIPRWTVIAALHILSLPALIMWSMMLMMVWFGPSMHGGMAAFGPGLFSIVGVIPLLLGPGVIYGMYRLSAADTQ